LIASNKASNFEIINVEQLLKEKAKRAMLVDSRLKSDFKRGTIPDSINLPVDCSPTSFEKALVRGLAIECGCFGGLAKREIGGVSLGIAALLACFSLLGFYFAGNGIEPRACE